MDWRRGVALVIVWAYAYQLCLWPLLFWLSTMVEWPAPPLLPWEHLMTGTGTLATIAGIDIARDRLVPEDKKSVQRL